MAQSTKSQKLAYPLPAYNFRVRVGDTVVSFAEVSGIAAEYDKVMYRNGLSFWEGEAIKTFYYDTYIPVTLRRGVVLGPNPLFLYEWLKKGDSRPVEVSLCDEKGAQVISWQIAKALPVKLQAPTFDAKTNEVSIETMELSVRGVSLVKH